MEASDIVWLRNYDLAHMIVLYSISIYITYAFEVERLRLALLYPQLCHMWKTLGAN